MFVDAKARKGEFAEIGTADADHARRPQGRNDLCILRGRGIAYHRRGCCRGDAALGIEEVLPGKGDAIEHAKRPALRKALRCRPRLHPRPLRQQRGKDGAIRIAGYLFQRSLRQGDGIERARLQKRAQPRKGTVCGDFGHFSVSVSALPGTLSP